MSIQSGPRTERGQTAPSPLVRSELWTGDNWGNRDFLGCLRALLL